MRYSVPEKIEKLLWEDNDFFNAVAKLGKVQSGRFPKIDQYANEEGFNMSFALAGYAPDDISISVTERVITISSSGIDDEPTVQPEILESDDAMAEYVRPPNLKVHKGMISRGIARRSFKVSFVIKDVFDCYNVIAFMEHGLLRIIIPFKEKKESKVVRIMESR